MLMVVISHGRCREGQKHDEQSDATERRTDHCVPTVGRVALDRAAETDPATDHRATIPVGMVTKSPTNGTNAQMTATMPATNARLPEPSRNID